MATVRSMYKTIWTPIWRGLFGAAVTTEATDFLTADFNSNDFAT
jgi:hypothetical protein